MSICESCPIEEKIYVCCARYPMTGEQVKMVFDNGVTLSVCPYFGKDGKCTIYSERPTSCRDFFCDRFSNDQFNETIMSYFF